MQVLKWLQDFSDRVEERAKGAAAEVNGLLDEAAALELNMKTAVVSFDNLTRQRFIEHASRGSNPCSVLVLDSSGWYSYGIFHDLLVVFNTRRRISNYWC
jgi:hypothetical protein